MIARRWIPPWSWFTDPSGGPTPGWPAWFDTNKRRPILAHPIGAAAVVWVFLVVLKSPPLPAIAAALLAEGVNQFYKAGGLKYHLRGWAAWETWSNVIWRELLALAGALLMWAGLAWWALR